jgi:nitrate/nitrite transporter NarK
VFAALIAPVLAASFGWSNVFGFAVAPLLLTLIAFSLMAKNAPERPKAKSMADYFKALGDRDSWWFMFFYSVTFGGFIGLASALPGYFNDQYGLSPVSAPCRACTQWRPSASQPWVSTCQVHGPHLHCSSLRCLAWVQATARYSSWYRSVFARKSA